MRYAQVVHNVNIKPRENKTKTDTKEELEGRVSWRPGNDETSECDHDGGQSEPYRRNHHELEAKEEEEEGRGERLER